MTFAKTNIRSHEQKQRLIDVFVNSVHVYDDKIIVTTRTAKSASALMNSAIKKKVEHSK